MIAAKWGVVSFGGASFASRVLEALSLLLPCPAPWRPVSTGLFLPPPSATNTSGGSHRARSAWILPVFLPLLVAVSGSVL